MTNTTVRRHFSNRAQTQQLSGSIDSAATMVSISDSFTTWPSQFPFDATLDFGTISAEVVLVTAITGTTATITRAQDGTSAVSHPLGATFDHIAALRDFDEANAHSSASTGVHGVAGSVVGTSDAQTLTNKTIDSPAITGTATGATHFGADLRSATSHVDGDATIGGDLAVAGAVSVPAWPRAKAVFDGTHAVTSGDTTTPLAIWTAASPAISAGGITVSSAGVTVSQDGDYDIYISLDFANNTSGGRGLLTTVNGTEPTHREINVLGPGPGGGCTPNVATLLTLSAGDVISCVAFQNTGNNLNLIAATLVVTLRA